MEEFDAVVIGSGQGADPLSRALASAGRKTAIIERQHVGGTCINEGCTPTKTMAASARVAYLAARAAEYGVRTGAISIDMAAVRQRKRAIVDDWRASGERRLRDAPGLELIMGEAHFTGQRAVAVSLAAGGERMLRAPLIVIDTGTRPAVPPLPGLDLVPFLDSTSLMELDSVPEHLLILGGGYVSVEFAQMFRRFGSRVSIVQRRDSLLPREDPDVAAALAGILEEDGIEVVLSGKAASVASAGTGVLLEIFTPSGERRLEGSHLLVATGRTPNTGPLHLEASGLTADEKGYIRVNDRLETTVEGIYAIGDVKGGPAFTHISYDDYRILRTNILEGGAASTKDRLVPYAIFTDPQLGRVGITETEAKARRLDHRVATLPMASASRAIETAETRGFLKALIDNRSDEILGCAMLGVDGGS